MLQFLGLVLVFLLDVCVVGDSDGANEQFEMKSKHPTERCMECSYTPPEEKRIDLLDEYLINSKFIFVFVRMQRFIHNKYTILWFDGLWTFISNAINYVEILNQSTFFHFNSKMNIFLFNLCNKFLVHETTVFVFSMGIIGIFISDSLSLFTFFRHCCEPILG